MSAASGIFSSDRGVFICGSKADSSWISDFDVDFFLVLVNPVTS